MLGSFHSFSLKLFSILTPVRTGCKIRHPILEETFFNFFQASHKVIRAVQFRIQMMPATICASERCSQPGKDGLQRCEILPFM